MGSLTWYAINLLNNHLFVSSQSPPATLFLALCTSDPGKSATGSSMNELPNVYGYARALIEFGKAHSRNISNSKRVIFPKATGNWSKITHWAVTDSAVYGLGNVYCFGEIATPVVVERDLRYFILEGQVNISFQSVNGAEMTTYMANALLNHLFNVEALPSPDTYITLATDYLSEGEQSIYVTQKEVKVTGYARKLVNKKGGASPSWNIDTLGGAWNAEKIDIGPATEEWGWIKSVVMVDSGDLDSGNILFYNFLDITPVYVFSGDTVSIDASEFTMAMY